MPTQAELKIKDKASKLRVAKGQERRDLRDSQRSALKEAESSQERSEIRESFKGKIHDIDTQPTQNKEGTDERIENDGIDKVETGKLAATGGGGGEEFELDVVKDDNTAGRASFTGGGII